VVRSEESEDPHSTSIIGTVAREIVYWGSDNTLKSQVNNGFKEDIRNEEKIYHQTSGIRIQAKGGIIGKNNLTNPENVIKTCNSEEGGKVIY